MKANDRAGKGNFVIKLQHTLYITEPDLVLKKDGQTLRAVHSDGHSDHIPLHMVDQIVTYSGGSIAPDVLGACATAGVGFSSFSQCGRFQFRIVGATTGNVLLRKRQYSLTPLERQYLAEAELRGKIASEANLLHRFGKNHMHIWQGELREPEQNLRALAEQADYPKTDDALRGIEGRAAKIYFESWKHLVLSDDPAFQFSGRTRRPPLDCCNALMSYGYTILTGDFVQALEATGLDPQAGILHGDRPGKPALALDLMEPFRASITDQLVLRLINLKMLRENMFERRADGGVYLTSDGRRVFLREWSQMRRKMVFVSNCGQHVPMGILPHLQAMQLSRWLRGEDNYELIRWE